MDKIEARKENTIAILRSIARRNHTIEEIQKDTGIGYLTIWYITNELVKKRYLKETTQKRDRTGRRPKFFDVSTSFYSIFVMEHQRTFSIIGINIEGGVSYRYEYFKRRDLSKKVDVQRLIGKIRSAYLFGKHCVDVFVNCNDDTAKYLPSNYIRTSLEDLIINGLSSDRTISLFKINNSLTVSVFSKIISYDSTVSEEDIKKILPIDEYFEYNGELFFGVFDALENNSIKNFYKLL